MIIPIRNRSTTSEIMDMHDLPGKELESVLQDLDTVNDWLGGNEITIKGIEKLLKNVDKTEEISIADIGCGGGSMLKEIAEFGRENGYNFRITGIDINEQAIKLAQAATIEYKEIDVLCMNVLNAAFEKHKYDIITSTLTLHHFETEKIPKLINSFVQQSTYGVVINDLERSFMAYYLFMTFSMFFLKTKIARQDGLTSILRGFKKEDFIGFAEQVEANKHVIKQCWAYRYQWIIYK